MNEQVKVIEAIEKVLNGSARVDLDRNDPALASVIGELHRARVRLDLSKSGIVVDFPQAGSNVLSIRRVGSAVARAPQIPIPVTQKAKTIEAVKTTPERQAVKPASQPVPKRSQHSYVPPSIADDFISVLCDEASHVVWLTGPTQCGKTTLVKYIGNKLGRKVYQINCRGDMGSEVFFGEKTVEVDKVSGQNHIVFQKGLVEQAMTEGLDAQGNEVGEASILFIDEAAAMPAHVAIGINRLLESDDPRRTIVIAEDGGRQVRSHSKFRVVLAANTVGRGATGVEAASYTAQMDALDISLLNRIAVCFKMGYDRKVEQHILLEKVGDDRITKQVIMFRDAVRGHIKAGKLMSPFSTKRIVDIANMYRVFGNIGKAIYYTVFEQLLPEEKPVYNEQVVAIMGVDLMKQFNDSGIDY